MTINYKSILNATWKVGVGLIGAGVTVFCIILAMVYFTSRFGRNEWGDRLVSKDIVIRDYENNTVRVWNKSTKEYTTKRLRWVSGDPCEGDSLTVFCDKDGMRGYINVKTGQIVIPAQYSKAWNFSEGLAAVLGGDGSIGFIDRNNNLVIDYIIPFEKEEDYIFKGGYCRAMYYEGDIERCALIRKDGSLALDWSHNYIGIPNEDGYRIVGNETGRWLIDAELNRVFPDVYDEMSFADGIEGVYTTKNHVKQLRSYDGTVVEPFVVDAVRRISYGVLNETGIDKDYVMDLDVMVYLVDCWEGLMDARTGSIITPACYWSIDMASKELIIATLGYDNEAVILDKKGKVIKE